MRPGTVCPNTRCSPLNEIRTLSAPQYGWTPGDFRLWSPRMAVTYSSAPTEDQLEQAADLVDSGGQLAAKLDRTKFRRSSVLVVALDNGGTVVGAAAVKPRQGAIAETGYLIVRPDHRRQGIAEQLTERRIDEARRKGIALLFSNVRRDNEPSIGNLRKTKFQHWGDFVSAYGTDHVISWFYCSLDPNRDAHADLKNLTDGLKRV